MSESEKTLAIILSAILIPIAAVIVIIISPIVLFIAPVTAFFMAQTIASQYKIIGVIVALIGALTVWFVSSVILQNRNAGWKLWVLLAWTWVTCFAGTVGAIWGIFLPYP